jgi:hypothetical protein
MVKKIWNDPVLSKVIAAGILAIIVAIYSYFQGWWPTIGHWILFESKIPNWLLIILSVGTFWKIIDIVSKQFRRDWQSYRKTKINGIVWRWDYNLYGELDKHSVKAYCPRCDYDLYQFGNPDPTSSAITGVPREYKPRYIAVGASVIAAQRITSSARRRSVGGNVTPRAWAVLRLRTNSTFLACSMGSSAGVAPLRILST